LFDCGINVKYRFLRSGINIKYRVLRSGINKNNVGINSILHELFDSGSRGFTLITSPSG